MTDLGVVLDFRNSIRSCTRCELHKTVTAPIPWHGDLESDICIVGEAPGRTEDAEGQPFVGSSGFLIRHLLRQADIDPSACTWVNSVSCWPRGTPSDVHRSACLPNLNGQLQVIQPKLIITLGVVAFEQVRQQTWPKLQHLHGKPQFWDSPFNHRNTRIMSTYHPAAALRGGKKYERMILEDLTACQQPGWSDTREQCAVCGEEWSSVDSWAVSFCDVHSMRQLKFPLAEVQQ